MPIEEIGYKAIGAKAKTAVIDCSTPMAVTYGRSAREAALSGQVIPAKNLEETAAK